MNAAVAGLWLAGVLLRYLFILRVHHPRHYVLTDARQLTDSAMRMVGSPANQTLFDTIWPPGAPALIARLLAGDPTLGSAALVHFLLSCALPLVAAHTGYLIAGRGVALIVLAVASLHFGFIHGGGFFLSETFFQMAMAAAIWATAAALVVDEWVDTRGGPRTAAVFRAALGAAVGLAWGLAASFRPNALPVAALVGGGLALHWVRRGRARSCWLLAGGLAGLTLALAPLADRCGALNEGRFCVVATNAAMNVALGQVDDAAGIEFFDPARPDLNSWWQPPGLLQHGYQGMLRIPHSIWDTGGVVRWALARAWRDPERFALHTLRNVIDIFRVDFWPPDLAPWPPWPQFVSGWLFLLAVVLPALASARRLALGAYRREQRSPWPAFLVTTLAAVMAVAAASIGEPRYRFPFDGVLIILVAARFAGVSLAERRELPPCDRRVAVAGLVVVGALAVATVAAIVAVSHPASPYRLNAAEVAVGEGPPPTVRGADDLRRPVAPQTAWNAPGNHLFRCRPDCAELRLTSPALQTAGEVEVTVDNNDAYRLTWYRAGRPLGHVDLPRTEAAAGLRLALVDAPPAAREGYDAIGVLPLFGDGSYALGHLRPLAP